VLDVKVFVVKLIVDMDGYNKAVMLIHKHREHYITAD